MNTIAIPFVPERLTAAIREAIPLAASAAAAVNDGGTCNLDSLVLAYPPTDAKDRLLYEAWAVISNASTYLMMSRANPETGEPLDDGVNGWKPETIQAWQAAAIRWRDKWHAMQRGAPNAIVTCAKCGNDFALWVPPNTAPDDVYFTVQGDIGKAVCPDCIKRAAMPDPEEP
jgi:hypothetical protein